MNRLQEEWRAVPSWPMYEVSNLGRIRRDGEFLNPYKAPPKGYLSVHLSNHCDSGIATVHRIVAAAFIGPCDPGMTINHIDGIMHNNRASNLEYIPPSANYRKAIEAQPYKRFRIKKARFKLFKVTAPSPTQGIKAKIAEILKP